MEKDRDNIIEVNNCNIFMECRKKLQVTGVNEVIRFNDEEIVVKTKLGSLNVKGEELKMNKLDIQSGEVLIAGKIDSCTYTNNYKAKSKDTILGKLFK